MGVMHLISPRWLGEMSCFSLTVQSLHYVKVLLLQPGWLHRLVKAITVIYCQEAGMISTSLARKHYFEYSHT